MLIIFNFNQSKNNSIYLYDIVNSIWYYANEDSKNRLSEINTYGFITLKGQYGLRVNHAMYSDEDKWFFLGDLDFEQFPLKYYGIGNDVPEDNIALMDARQISTD